MQKILMPVFILAVFFAALLAVLHVSVCFAEEPITVKTEVAPTVQNWPVPALLTIRQELANWLETDKLVEPQRRTELLANWSETEPEPKISGTALFELTVNTMRQALPAVSTYLEACNALAWQELPFGQPVVLPQIPLQVHLGDSATKYLQSSLQYYLAQRLVQARLYDEAASLLDEMTPENSVDPVGTLLLRAVACNHLTQVEKGLTALEEFKIAAETDSSVPRRYTELAKLLEFDLNNQKKEKEDNPEKIAKKMDDVRRRLGKGRTDNDTQDAENGVLKSLDKLIEKIEQQAKKQSESSDGDQGQQANDPAKDSRILKQKGPGNVDRRDFNPDGNWGGLPPKEREEALLRIEKEFPAHYRDIIEQYFREMAGEHKE